MTAIAQLRRLWEHAAWADAELLAAIETRPSDAPAEVLREYAHVLGAEEVWLARLERRSSRTPVWPELTLREIGALAPEVRAGYARYLAGLEEGELSQGVEYTNSAGRAFTTAVADILLQVVLHGQYHRGKINLLLRQAGLTPAPVDFISYVRGVPAATTDSATVAR
jgi:uncharacterized damage-inducible protein DinB